MTSPISFDETRQQISPCFLSPSGCINASNVQLFPPVTTRTGNATCSYLSTNVQYVFIAHILSWMKGCVSAWLMATRFEESSIKIFSNRSFNWLTFLNWSSGRFWLPINSDSKSRQGFNVDITTTFSWPNNKKKTMSFHYNLRIYTKLCLNNYDAEQNSQKSFCLGIKILNLHVYVVLSSKTSTPNFSPCLQGQIFFTNKSPFFSYKNVYEIYWFTHFVYRWCLVMQVLVQD